MVRFQFKITGSISMVGIRICPLEGRELSTPIFTEFVSVVFFKVKISVSNLIKTYKWCVL